MEAPSTHRGQPPGMHESALWKYGQKGQRVATPSAGARDAARIASLLSQKYRTLTGWVAQNIEIL